MRPELMPCAIRKFFVVSPAARAKRDVVFARSALVGVTFDSDRMARILPEPDRLRVQN